MDSTPVGMGLRLHHIGGQGRIGELDQGQILADLRHAGAPARQLVWLSMRSLMDFDRVLLACDDRSGRCEGALLVQCHAAGETPFLAIEALSSGPARLNEAMLQRMLAYLMLRFDTLADRPKAILARTRSPALCRVMRSLSRGIGDASFYPEPVGSVISMRTAALAHRAARRCGPDLPFAAARSALRAGTTGLPPDGPMLAMLDLRFMDEAALDNDAHHLLRTRLPRSATRRTEPHVLPLPVAAQHDIPRIPAHVAAIALRASALYPSTV